MKIDYKEVKINEGEFITFDKYDNGLLLIDANKEGGLLLESYDENSLEKEEYHLKFGRIAMMPVGEIWNCYRVNNHWFGSDQSIEVLEKDYHEKGVDFFIRWYRDSEDEKGYLNEWIDIHFCLTEQEVQEYLTTYSYRRYIAYENDYINETYNEKERREKNIEKIMMEEEIIELEELEIIDERE